MSTIRAMHPDDLDSLYPLWQEQTTLLARVGEMRDVSLQRDAWTAAMQTYLADTTHRLLYTACDAHGQPVGCAIGWEAGIGMLPGVIEPTGVIADLILDMHHPHPGAASGLVNAMHAAFAERGIHRVIALSHPHSVLSQAFWRSRGGAAVLDGFIVGVRPDRDHPSAP